MAQHPQNFSQDLFGLPTVPAEPTFENILKTLQTKTPTETELLPAVRQEFLESSNRFLQPGIEGINRDTEAGLARVTSQFQRRGLTASSIEAQALGQRQLQGQEQISRLVGQFGIQGAQLFAQLQARAQAGDVDAARQMRLIIAQTLGQKLSQDRSVQSFTEEISQLEQQQEKNRQSALISQLLQSITGVGGAVFESQIAKQSKNTSFGSTEPENPGFV